MSITSAAPTAAQVPNPDEALGEVSRFLEQAIKQFQTDPSPTTRGRPRILSSLCLWAGMLVCLLKGHDSQRALWRMICHYGVFSYPPIHISDQAVYKRLETEGDATLVQLFAHVRTLLQQRLSQLVDPNALRQKLAPFAQEVVALDEMTCDQVRRMLPALRDLPAGDDQLIPGKIVALFDVRQQQWQRIEFLDDFHQNCKRAAHSLLTGLRPGTLLLCDLGYFAFDFFDWLTDNQFYFVSRLRAKTSLERLHVFYENGQTLDALVYLLDALVYLGAYRSDRAAHAVRLVQFRQGEARRTYITNVTDPQKLSLLEIAQLYARRWEIESAFRLLKQHLHLHLLWSAKSGVVRQQLWCALIVAQVIHALQWEIALRAGVDLFDVSLPLMLKYLPQYFSQSHHISQSHHFARSAEFAQTTAVSDPQRVAKVPTDPISGFIADSVSAGFIRASRRYRVMAPQVPPESYTPAPPNLVVERIPRYAQRKCGKRIKESQ